jgi:hypothetical protein
MVVPRVSQDGGDTEVSLSRGELIVAVSGLLAGLLALPLPPIAGGPEIAATLAVVAVIALAGARWSLALVVATEVLLVATYAPFVIGGGGGDDVLRGLGIASAAAALPGVISFGRSAPHALELFGVAPNPRSIRIARGVFATALFALVGVPLL